MSAIVAVSPVARDGRESSYPLASGVVTGPLAIGNALTTLATFSHDGYIKIQRCVGGDWRVIVHIDRPRSNGDEACVSTGNTLERALAAAGHDLIRRLETRCKKRGGVAL